MCDNYGKITSLSIIGFSVLMHHINILSAWEGDSNVMLDRYNTGDLAFTSLHFNICKHIVKHEKLCSAEKRSEVRRCQILTSVSNATVTAHGPDLIIPPNLAGGIFGLVFSLTWLYVAMRG